MNKFVADKQDIQTRNIINLSRPTKKSHLAHVGELLGGYDFFCVFLLCCVCSH